MSKSLVCFDIGSDTLKMTQFAADKDALQLEDYAVIQLGIPPDSSLEERNTVVAQTIRFTLDERKLKPKSIHISLSGQSVFVRFVKLPAVEESKIAQIVRYEAQQQVPFPIDEVEWDHQVIGDTSGEEIDIVLVAIKTEIVSGLIAAIRKQHIEVETVDVSALALYNAMIYNEGPFETSTALIDLGAKTTDLIIAEGINLWSRSIPIGGDNFTQAIAKELDVPLDQADKLKRLLTIGGDGHADETVRRAAAAAGAVLNRLLAEVRRSIGYYRSQSQGTPVQRILISGGGSFIKGIAEFLAEKLRVQVSTLSPLAKVSVAPGANAEGLKAQGRLLGDAVGLGLRAAGRGIMSVNLIPKAIVYQRELSKKKIFIVGAAACLIGAVLVWGLNAQAGAHKDKVTLDELTRTQTAWQGYATSIGRVRRDLKKIEANVSEIERMRAARLYWVDFIETIKREKPTYAWFTGIVLEGIEDPGNQLKRQFSGAPLGPGPGSMPYPGSGLGSMGSRIAPPTSPMGPKPPTGTSATRKTTAARPRVKLEGYLKITSRSGSPESRLARQVNHLREALEKRNRYFSNVTVLDSKPLEGSERFREKLAKFTFEAELDVPIEF